MTPDQAQPENDPASKQGSLDEVINSPATGPDLRVMRQVADALSAISDGEQLDRYFGISSGIPEQPPEEAARSDELIARLREATKGPSEDLSSLLDDIARHTGSSGADPDALRALRRLR